MLMTSPLDYLPLFASDREIATALVGKDRASEWLKKRLPTLEKFPGFPKVDPFHDGRAVPLIRLFYVDYLGIANVSRGMPDGEEDPSVWRTKRTQRASKP